MAFNILFVALLRSNSNMLATKQGAPVSGNQIAIMSATVNSLLAMKHKL